MKNKIFTFYFILVFVVLLITGFFSYYLTQHFYKMELEERLTNSALLIGHQILELISKTDNNSNIYNKKIINDFDFNKTAKIYSELLSKDGPINWQNKVRITFIDYDGEVLGESDEDFANMENHLNRKEIIEAIEGRTGKDIRFSGTIEMNFLYIAVPIQEIKTIVRVSLPLVQVQKIYNIIFNYEIIGILICILFTLLLAFKFSTMITNPISELIVKSHEITLGNYSVRAETNSKSYLGINSKTNYDDELGQLASTFNEMASKLESTVYKLKNNNLLMDTILNSMTDAIIAVDNSLHIILINSIACKIFGIAHTNGTSPATNIIGSSLFEYIRINQLNEMLKDTINKKLVLSKEISLGYNGGKILKVTTMPVKPISSNPFSETSYSASKLSFPEGAVLSIQDITNLKKLEQIRTEFVSNVTHELKTPLTSIRGFVETLRNGAIEDEEVAGHFLEIIDIEAERLYVLINDILQLSEIESGKPDGNIENYNLKQIIEETVQILKSKAEKHGISIDINAPDNLLVMANKDRIKQLLINLIDNGIKYNKAGGNVSISAYLSEGKLVIKVTDTGIGIPEQHLPRIFERFYRVDKGRSRSMGGTGLGLAIVKHIINLYNGNIKVNSTLGAGTEFIIQLPRNI